VAVRGVVDQRRGDDVEAQRCFLGALNLDASFFVSIFIPLYQIGLS
jgi:hypothetical protein